MACPHGSPDGSARRPDPEKLPAMSSGRNRRPNGRFPLRLIGLQLRMRDQEVPDHGLKSFRMWRDIVRIDGRNDHAGIGDLSRIAAVAADYPKHPGANSFRELQGRHQIRTDVPFKTSTADREDKNGILR